ncbi:hypothetical protein P7C73_g2139, partial [Tremellales sp. Uapishka_1]
EGEQERVEGVWGNEDDDYEDEGDEQLRSQIRGSSPSRPLPRRIIRLNLGQRFNQPFYDPVIENVMLRHTDEELEDLDIYVQTDEAEDVPLSSPPLPPATEEAYTIALPSPPAKPQPSTPSVSIPRTEMSAQAQPTIGQGQRRRAVDPQVWAGMSVAERTAWLVRAHREIRK